MNKIERPDWLASAPYDLDNWFDKNFKGKIAIDPSDLIEVWSTESADELIWFMDGYRDKNHTHKAHIIKSSIQPIEKEDTAESLLRWYVKLADSLPVDPQALNTMGVYDRPLYHRAKQLLAEKDGD